MNPLRLARDLSASARFAPTSHRRRATEAWLEQVLRDWGLEPALGGRWLAAADTHLCGAGEITITADYDPDLQTCTIEIWNQGRRIYGIDDWLG